ncbi:hypothetical protein OH738_12980 [Streptomyces hirsutus]|uniref:Uncharacterized protein n=1 Tax=Streptomyces hirsutus TaxID=35620 RepID=A0ABZ1GS26_9ACTN|nr:hypothetical protein [Streptomyces hirsutus]WSD08925.1 hypothetical protein OIE73_26450 [Streptomyces hirsutus]WTD17620.1 hypothetical protein OH738_12980 [Streptomyces hirsutus]
MDYRMLVDPAAEAIGAVAVHVPEGTSVVAAAALLEDVLLRFPGVETVALMVGGRRAALASRSFLTRAFGAPVGDKGTGDGDGATLPGASTRYVALRYACAEPGCAGEAYTAYHDDRFRPACPLCGRPMELVT